MSRYNNTRKPLKYGISKGCAFSANLHPLKWLRVCKEWFCIEWYAKGKTLIPFSTHAGSGLSGFDTKLAGACPDSNVGTGLAVKGADAQNDKDSVKQSVNDWLAGLGY